MTSRARFGSPRRTPKKPQTLLDYDMQQCEALGYGCHYGNYKADHPNTRAEFERLTDAPPPKKQVDPGRYERTCVQCGKTFYLSNKTRVLYCSPDCRLKANSEREKAKRQPIFKSCECCGKRFQSIRGAKYCGAECYAYMQRVKAAMNKYKRKAAKANG